MILAAQSVDNQINESVGRIVDEQVSNLHELGDRRALHLYMLTITCCEAIVLS